MKRSKRNMAMVATIFVVAIGMSGVRAADCTDGVSWRYCGEHVRGSRLPMTFVYNPSGAPSMGGVANLSVPLAITAAQAQWNAAWPNPLHRLPCGGPLCAGSTSTRGLAQDGVNTVLWGDPATCGAPGALAVTCLYHEPDGKRIAEADIVLNRAISWRIPLDTGVVTGEANGTWADGLNGSSLVPINPLRGDWYDVQSVLTHEFGHVLGLEHIGNATRPWPHDATDTARYLQTMYRWDYPSSTTKRTLAEGDVLGLLVVAADSTRDR